MLRENIRLPDRPYRRVFIVQNRDYWKACPFAFDASADLVLTFDFALAHQITLLGGTTAYVDHLVDTEVMERYNYETYEFFAQWYRDEKGQDLLAYRGLEVGNAFRLHLWNDLTYSARLLVNLLALRQLRYECLLLGIDDQPAMDLVRELGLKHESWGLSAERTLPEYAFPIFRWMDERVRPDSLALKLKAGVKTLLGELQQWAERFHLLHSQGADVFVQPHYSTRGVLERLKQDSQVNVVLEHYTWRQSLTRERRLPVGKPSRRHRELSRTLLERLHHFRNARWDIEGVALSDLLYGIMFERVAAHLPEFLRALDDITAYFASRHLRLMVSVTETWPVNCLLMNYCRARGIPIFIIINGYLGEPYLDEDKHADVINAYGESIKNHYFRGMDNIVCLGDPRMDYYINQPSVRHAWTDSPTVMVGAAGFNNINLNSYLAYEFDFLNEVMSAFRALQARGRKMNLVLKTRANGYKSQYADFLREYYPDLTVQLYDTVPFNQLICQADFYISFYSQTLIEASCLGIPVLYYKNDTEILDPPFDGKSELVTALTYPDLLSKIELFYQRDPIYNRFQDKAVLEKYVGPLDGHSLERNMNLIYSLISGTPAKERK